MSEIRVSHGDTQDQLDGLGEIADGVELPKDFIGADGGFEGPSVEKILEALEGMQGLSLEDKEALKSQLLQQRLRSFEEGMEHPWEIPAGSFLANQSFVLFSLLTIIALIFVFFGLKLYRSLVEKERKREEKRKLKMQKKRK
ncbi:uncharacterized protein LOC117646502 [Thrips palmi]|uniref:Uncharacterized protein LOC117646502 n=1 Tax=Thrips palmi TaxID=161013 RepID=A0A6P8Z1A9_THRPL|nr:uncharacterized protein LOC117646502 [Thrips palmi]